MAFWGTSRPSWPVFRHGPPPASTPPGPPLTWPPQWPARPVAPTWPTSSATSSCASSSRRPALSTPSSANSEARSNFSLFLVLSNNNKNREKTLDCLFFQHRIGVFRATVDLTFSRGRRWLVQKPTLIPLEKKKTKLNRNFILDVLFRS